MRKKENQHFVIHGVQYRRYVQTSSGKIQVPEEGVHTGYLFFFIRILLKPQMAWDPAFCI